MTIEFRHLRYAVLTADSRSFASAAAALRVKQSTLSRKVLDLEIRLGIKLFERTTRGAEVTENGKAFIEQARRILTDIDNLRTTAHAIKYGEEGRIAIGFASSLMTGNLRAAISDFMRRFPDVQFDGIENGTDRLGSMLQAGIIDAVVLPSDADIGQAASRNLWAEKLLLVLPDGHAANAIETLFWTDLRREVFVLPTGGIGPSINRLLTAKLASYGYRANIIMQATSLESIVSTVSFGRYLCLATEASLGVTWPGLNFREISDHGSPARLDYALYWRDDNDNPALKRFFKLIEERYPA